MGEMLFQDDDKVVQVAMQIVIAAGDARNAAGKALDCVGQFDFAGAKEYMKERTAIFLKHTMHRQK